MPTDDQTAADRLVAIAVALLLEPLPVDEALTGPEMLELIHAIADVAPSADPAAEADISAQLSAACAGWGTEQALANELRSKAAMAGVPLSAVETRAALAVLTRAGSGRRLRALQGLPPEALDLRPTEAALAIQKLHGLEAARRRALARHLTQAHESALSLDLNREIRDLRHGGWLFGLISTTADAARGRVGPHLMPPADQAGAPAMAKILESVKLAKQELDGLRAQWAVGPGWTHWVMPKPSAPASRARTGALRWLLQARADGSIDELGTALLMDNRTRHFLATGPAQTIGARAREVAPARLADEAVARMMAGLAVSETTSPDAVALWRDLMLSNGLHLARAVLNARAATHDRSIQAAVDAAVERARSPFGPADPSRPRLRQLLHEISADVHGAHTPLPATTHPAISDTIRDLTRTERDLAQILAPRPAPHGPLRVAIAGRTKAGKTTLRKALTSDADDKGIGRGAHRTTRSAEAFGWRGLEFVDTPGVAAYDDDYDAETAMSACRSADAVLWVYAETLRVEELEHLSALLAIGKPVLVLINVKWKVKPARRLDLFTRSPHLAFRHLDGHAQRVADVATAVGAHPPTVLPAHLGAAFEALRTNDLELADRAHVTSRLPEVERALHDLLVTHAQPLRATALAEAVRTPLTATAMLVADRTHQLAPRLGPARQQVDAERRDLAAAVDAAERAANAVLDRKLAAMAIKRGAFVRAATGNADLQDEWTKFVEEHDLRAVVSAFADRMNRETTKVGLLLEREDQIRRTVSSIEIDQRPRRGFLRWLGAAVTGAIQRIIMQVVGGRIGAAAAAKSAARKVPWLGWALLAADALAGASKAISDEVAQSRLEDSQWRQDSHAAVAAETNRLEAVLRRQVATVATTARRTVEEHLHVADEATDAAERRLNAYRTLAARLDASTADVDLVLARRLAALCTADPDVITRAKRTPGTSFVIWVGPEDNFDGTLLADTVSTCLRERLTIRPTPPN